MVYFLFAKKREMLSARHELVGIAGAHICPTYQQGWEIVLTKIFGISG